MKRVFFIMLAVALLLTGCAKPESNNMIKADNITIGYGVSSYAMFGADQSVIDDLLNKFNSLTFEKATDEMDLVSAFDVNFSYNGKGVKSFWVDKHGVFWLDGETQCYKVSSGSFDYQHLKAIYEGSKNIPVGTALPVIKHKKTANEDIDITLQKEISKNNLLIMIDIMTKPTQEKPNLALSSNPYDYIDAHRDTFSRLVAGGQSTVTIFIDILKNSNEFGLDKYIMAAVCAEITGIGNSNDKTWASVKEWLKLYDERDGDS